MKTVKFYRDLDTTGSVVTITVDNQAIANVHASVITNTYLEDSKGSALKSLILTGCNFINFPDSVLRRVKNEKLDLTMNWHWGNQDTPYFKKEG